MKFTQENEEQIYEGILQLSGVCDGAYLKDNRGFNRVDTGYGKRMAAIIQDRGKLTPNEISHAHKMLRKYHKQLPFNILDMPIPPNRTVCIKSINGEKKIVFCGQYEDRIELKNLNGKWNSDLRAWFFPADLSQLKLLKIKFPDGRILWPETKIVEELREKRELKPKEKAYYKVKLRSQTNPDLLSVYSQYGDKDFLKAYPGAKWEPDLKCWQLPIKGFVVHELLSYFIKKYGEEMVKVDEEANTIDKQYCRALLTKPNELLKELNITGKGIYVPNENIPSWEHQKITYHYLRFLFKALQGGGMFLDMGIGKTKNAIDLINLTALELEDQIRHTTLFQGLIICPKPVIRTWREQFDMHKVGNYKIVFLDTRNTTKKAKQIYECLNNKIPFVCVLNYDSVWREELGKLILENEWSIIVCDEIHRGKNARSQIGKYLAKLALKSERLLGLTGTPIPHSPMDVFGIFQFIEPARFGRSYTRFRNRYAIMGGYKGKEIIGYKNQEEMHNKIYSSAIRFEIGDVIDLPDFQDITILFELEESLKKYQKEESKITKYFRDKKGKKRVKNLVLTKLLRFQQVTGGFIPIEDETISQKTESVGEEKQRQLKELFEDLPENEPIIVFGRFHEDLNTIKRTAKECGRTCSEMSGRRDESQEWEEGRTNVLCCQVRSGSLSKDFTRSHYCIFYSVGFSLGEYNQARRRVWRPGQKKKVVYYHLIAENTIDQKIMNAIDRKEEIADSILKFYTQ